MPQIVKVPQSLKPYTWHGLDLTVNDTETQATGDCPWCGKEGKFSVEIATGKWRCFSCNEGSNDNGTAISGGNSHTFLRLLWDYSSKQEHVCIEERLQLLADERRIALSTLRRWGVVNSSLIDDDFLVPGYGTKGNINQLYRYRRIFKDGRWKRVLWATPKHGVKDGSNQEVYHTLFGLNPALYDTGKPTIYLCEGPWDAMALWQALRQLKWTNGPGSELVKTSNESKSLLADTNVLAVPGCTTFKASWCEVFGGKKVVLLFDNDHPRTINGRNVMGGGYAGMVSVARQLQSANQPPESINYLCWSKNGFDPELPSGYDVRDMLSGSSVAEQVSALFSKIEAVPNGWLEGVKKKAGSRMSVALCNNWNDLVKTWGNALEWRDTMSDCLATLLAVCLSTDQIGDQLFLQLVGEPGSGKTELCEALLRSRYCVPVEKLNGFFSGWKKGEDDKDFSLINRANHKTLVTPEWDLLRSSMNFREVMSQQRRIFDGKASASYRNRDEDRHYVGLRTPWIIAGTPAMLNSSDSHLGDRFLRFFMDKPTLAQRKKIMRFGSLQMIENTKLISNGIPDETIPPKLLKARQATGGYVDYLRENTQQLLCAVSVEEWAIDQCETLATFTSYLRSRRDPNPDSEMICVEEPTRLNKQFVRLACNLTAVLGKKVVDKEVMRVVRRVAISTSTGLTMDISNILFNSGDAGVEAIYLVNRTGKSWKILEPHLIFLAKINVAENFREDKRCKVKWRMLESFRPLYQRTMVLSAK